MRILRQGKSAANVIKWQEYLQKEGLFAGATSRMFDEATRNATLEFQRRNNLTPDGIVGPVTEEVATKAGFTPDEECFELGPDRDGSLRESRPYFLVPLDNPELREAALDRVVSWIGKQAHPLTDIFMLSHGWHRNFFDAVSVYDRLMGRFAHLLRRGRVKPPSMEFNPLFLTLHWHSDPGVNSFYDTSGRRSKASFLGNAKHRFADPDGNGNFSNDFEDIFELFSRMSAPGVQALGDWKLFRLDEQKRLKCRFAPYELRDASGASIDEKVAVAWLCYHESTKKRVLVDQTAPPGEFLTARAAMRDLITFIISTVGVVAVLGILWKLSKGRVADAWAWIANLHAPIAQLPGYLQISVYVGAYLLLAILGGAYLRSRRQSETATEEQPQRKGGSAPPVLAILCFLWLEIPLAALALGWVTVNYFLGMSTKGKWLFKERVGEPGQKPTADRAEAKSFGERLTDLARRPVTLMRAAASTDSAVLGPLSALDSQLAFFEMQRKGVNAGADSALFLRELYARLAAADCACPHNQQLAHTRLHLIGHSFGGVVVANACRHLVAHTIHTPTTVCLVQAALASSWFEKEIWLLDAIKARQGVIANIFSRYDTANGFYYPYSNQGRLAAGFVGLYAGPDIPVAARGQGGEFASLASPPELQYPATRHPLLNLDASRIIYEGPPAAGGGHDDLFKDDVVNLIWAATTPTLMAPAAIPDQAVVVASHTTKAAIAVPDENTVAS